MHWLVLGAVTFLSVSIAGAFLLHTKLRGKCRTALIIHVLYTIFVLANFAIAIQLVANMTSGHGRERVVMLFSGLITVIYVLCAIFLPYSLCRLRRAFN